MGYNPIVKYYKDYINFFNNRLKDGNKELKELKVLYENRLLTKEWRNIYPLNNYDFNYKNYVLNGYNPYSLGISSNPTMNTLSNNINKLSVYPDAMIKDPTPDKNTVSGIDDVSQSPFVGNIIKKIKYEQAKLPLPYPDFKKDYPESKYPTTGTHSSSYFIKVGQCNTPINNKNTCLKKGFRWIDNSGNIDNDINRFFTKKRENFESKINKLGKYHVEKHVPNNSYQKYNENPTVIKNEKTKQLKPMNPNKITGNCYRPKFLYINNEARGVLGNSMRGYTPALANDILSITPDKLLSIMSGKAVEGGGFVPCKEGFVSDIYYGKPSKLRLIIYCCIFVAVIVIFIQYFL